MGAACRSRMHGCGAAGGMEAGAGGGAGAVARVPQVSQGPTLLACTVGARNYDDGSARYALSGAFGRAGGQAGRSGGGCCINGLITSATMVTMAS